MNIIKYIYYIFVIKLKKWNRMCLKYHYYIGPENSIFRSVPPFFSRHPALRHIHRLCDYYSLRLSAVRFALLLRCVSQPEKKGGGVVGPASGAAGRAVSSFPQLKNGEKNTPRPPFL